MEDYVGFDGTGNFIEYYTALKKYSHGKDTKKEVAEKVLGRREDLTPDYIAQKEWKEGFFRKKKIAYHLNFSEKYIKNVKGLYKTFKRKIVIRVYPDEKNVRKMLHRSGEAIIRWATTSGL